MVLLHKVASNTESQAALLGAGTNDSIGLGVEETIDRIILQGRRHHSGESRGSESGNSLYKHQTDNSLLKGKRGTQPVRDARRCFVMWRVCSLRKGIKKAEETQAEGGIRGKEKGTSHAGNRTRIGRVRACYPNQLDYMGSVLSLRHGFMRVVTGGGEWVRVEMVRRNEEWNISGCDREKGWV